MTPPPNDEDVLVREFTKELHNHNAAVFVGAGLSVGAGYVDWLGLLRDLIVDLGLDPNAETDLVTLAQYHCNKVGGRGRLTQVVFDKFRETNEPTINHRLLSRLPIHTYWTTNYDKLLETALTQEKRIADVKYTANHLAITRLDRDVYVYKMHGDIDHPADAVLTRDDYEQYSFKMAPFLSALKGNLIEKTFLFLGFSFTDPNIDYILSRVRIQYGQNQRVHYAIQKRVTQNAGESGEVFQRRQLKQDYFIEDLKRFGIQTVLVDDYTDITRVLRRIENRFRRASIFVSGSAHEYGGFADPKEFLHNLAYRIAEEKNRVITGFGLGVGDAVINGAVSWLDQAGKTISDEDVMLRPFPQFATGGTSLPDRWEAYRKLMIQHAGIAVFVFGNKIDHSSGVIVSANGMRREFELCLEREVKVLPIGATGYLAEELWNDVNARFDTCFPGASGAFRNNFGLIGNRSTPADQLIRAVVEMIRELQRGE